MESVRQIHIRKIPILAETGTALVVCFPLNNVRGKWAAVLYKANMGPSKGNRHILRFSLLSFHRHLK